MSVMGGEWCEQCYLLDRLEIGIIVLDDDQRISMWNKWVETMSGIPRANALGRDLAALFPEVAGSRLQRAVRDALGRRFSALLSPGLNRPVLGFFRTQEDRGFDKRIEQQLHVIPMQVSGRQKCLIQIQDVTANVRRERLLRVQSGHLRDASYRDQLTGVANRRRFDEALLEMFKGCQSSNNPLSLLMVDVDHFKRYNDHYGHPRGDDCLRSVAEALRAGLRQGGDLLCRYGGEEFSVLLPTANEKLAGQIAERLRIRVEAMMLAHENSPSGRHVTVSIGAATVMPNVGAEPKTLLAAADSALYQAKFSGRNCVMAFGKQGNALRGVN